MKFKLLIVCFLLMASGLHAMENLEFDLLNSNNGLSSEEILDIYQDSKGYLWFITREGLNRYDGYEIKIFKPGMDDLNFNTASFECICEDSEERLWLGTSEKGIL